MTTARQCYEGVLIELNKVNAPSLLLEDFNYLFNKVIYQYINKRYNIYDMNQQTTDDLSMLSTTAHLIAEEKKPITSVTSKDSFYNAVYEFTLPADYLHLLNCICTYKVNKPFKCYQEGSYVLFAATRLTSDLWAQVINNVYLRPTYKHPYYFIHNINTTPSTEKLWSDRLITTASSVVNIPTDALGADFLYIDLSNSKDSYNNPYASQAVPELKRTVTVGNYEGFVKTGNARIVTESGQLIGTFTINKNGVVSSNLDSSIVANFNGHLIRGKEGEVYTGIKLLNGETVNARAEYEQEPVTNTIEMNGVEKIAGVRYGPANNVRLEIRYGKDNTLFTLESIDIDYLKIPQYIRLTQELLDLTEDRSQIMEYPDYICQEIINELVHVIMENTSNPRLLTHIPVTLSIASPVQQLQTKK